MFRSFSLVVLTILATGVATAQWDPCELFVIETDGAVLYNRPDGQGHAFTEARLGPGLIVNATAHLLVVDPFGNPVANLAAEDLWLETTGGGLVFSAMGTIADGPTDSNGQAQWQQPLAAGGCSVGEQVVAFVAGMLIDCPRNLAFVSADIDGNLEVDLADLTPFASAYHGAYAPCCDLAHDGTINLSDLSLFAAAYGL